MDVKIRTFWNGRDKGEICGGGGGIDGNDSSARSVKRICSPIPSSFIHIIYLAVRVHLLFALCPGSEVFL